MGVEPFKRDLVPPLGHPEVRCAICGRRVPKTGCPEHEAPKDALFSSPPYVSPPVHLPEFRGYRVIGILGQGGFGTVFDALRTDTGQAVAIKLAGADQPDAALRLERERRAQNEIGPPHVPRVHEFGTLPSGLPYLVMDRAEGIPLSERLILTGPMSLSDVAMYARGFLQALEAIHRAGYVHRDLKPENIFLDDVGQATIIDLGLAIFADSNARDLSITSEGIILGTSEYMSPEQGLETGVIDARSDIYSTGIILYEMLTGRPPFWGPAALVRQSHGSRRPLRPSALVMVPPEVEEVVLRCLAKNPNERFPNVSELKEALEEAFSARISQSFFLIGGTPSPESDHEMPPVSISLRERRHLSAIAFQSDAEVNVVQRRVVLLGAELAHASKDRYVAVYSQELGDSPGRLAIHAAHELIRQHICSRALVDRISVSIRTRPDGSKRYISSFFGASEHFPTEKDPPGVFLSPAALDTIGLPHGVPVPGRDWVLAPRVDRDEPDDATAQNALMPRLFGLESVTSELMESAERAIHTSTPTLVMLTAEFGYGKSHLAAVLTDRLRSREPHTTVAELRAYAATEAGGFRRLYRELLRMALDAPDSRPDDGGAALVTAHYGPERGAELWPIIALGLGWITPDDPALRALELAPGALHSSLVTTLGGALRKKASKSPLCMIIDDAHLAEDTALLACEHAALAGNSNPLWICLLGLPYLEQTYASWGEQAAARLMIHMPSLSAESMGALCRHLLRPAESVPERAVNLLVARAEGVPLVLVELIRSIKKSGMIRRPEGGGAFYLAADELDGLSDFPVIEWLARQQFDQLTAPQKAHACLLSVLAPDIHLSDVKKILRRLDAQGAGAEFLLDPGIAAKQLVASGLLVEPVPDYPRFRHPLVGELLARSVSASQSHQIHLAALQHYRSLGDTLNEQGLNALARHAEKAGYPAIAESAYLALAERARERQTYLDAEQFYTRALAVCTNPSPTIYRARGQMRYRLARYHDAIADFAKARGLLEESGDSNALLDVLLDEATALDWMDDYTSSAARVQQAKELLTPTTNQSQKAALLLGLGRSLHREGHPEEAAHLLQQAAELARPLGEEGYETEVIARLLLGFILQGLGRLNEAITAIDRSIALCEQHRDMLHLASAINGRALIRAGLGNKAGMIADFERMRAIGSELGKAMLEIAAQFNLGEYLYLMNDLAEAEAPILSAIEIGRRTGGPERAVLALLLARFRNFQGRFFEAQAIVQRIRENESAGTPEAQLSPSDDVLCTMVELCTRNAGENAGENADEEEWERLLKRSAEFSFGPEKLEVLEAGALSALRMGQKKAARSRAERAFVMAEGMPHIMKDRLERLGALLGSSDSAKKEAAAQSRH